MTRPLITFSLLASVALIGCSGTPERAGGGVSLPSAPAQTTTGPDTTLFTSQATAAPRQPPQIISGSGEFVRPGSAMRGLGGGEGEPIDVNFVNADVRAVLDAVLGGMLNLNYTIDPKVQGQVTIRTTRPLPRAQALAAIDAVLRAQGFAIVSGDGFYQVVPVSEAAAQAPFQRLSAAEQAAGFSTAIVPVRFISTADIDKIVRPLTRPGLIQLTDTNRNIFIVSGTAREIESFTQLVASFDVDWLAGLSFSLFTLQSVEPAKLEEELRQVLQLNSGPLQGMVEFVPLPRLNALLVAAKRPEFLATIGGWVERLDHTTTEGGRMVHYYEVQNGSASELAGSLNRLMGRGGGSSAGDTRGSEGGRSAGRGSMTTTTSTTSASTSGGFGSSSLGGGSLGGSSGIGGALSTSPASPLATAPSSRASSDTGGDGEGIPELKGAKVVADERRNALLIYATATQYAMLEQALTRLDSPREQVLIEATIAEVTLNNDLNFGVQWFLDRGSSTAGYGAAAKLGASYPNFNYTFLTPNTQVVLNALSSVTDVQILSAPRLMVLNNETARLQVGDEVPVVVQQATSTLTSDSAVVNSIQYQSTGVILEVTPRINHSGAVVLDVNQEVSSVATTTTSGIDSPTIQQRKISSIVNIQDGETVALGGLISDTSSKSGSGIPYLSDIPVVGKLFGSDKNSHGRTELLVFLRPVIVRNVIQAREVTDALKARMNQLEALAGANGTAPR
ncbi:General secretion pathway protein D [Nitrospirillum viridazoti Y2]|uniref:General secretion pathway protein D n=1 Tax=Nitrospirillum amazonense TaxID=28077 RepID=A0A560HQU3_9PROT|nr:secretin N-terminal domain-containing protein [Nitrospirillum amazonense]EGY02702.1 General secretion pathway protein D [Nitrospirillum amazonense Y2]TWB48957.1 general secretion pathway protein D [Nitrospirillum amazonense]